MEVVSLSLSLCGSLSLVAGPEATRKSVAIYGQSQSPAVLIQRPPGLLRGGSNVLHCELGQHHPLLAASRVFISWCVCVCTEGCRQGLSLAWILLIS